jgi:hypothetical protein
MAQDRIARLKITLDDVEPAVLRRVQAPLDVTLERLHLVLQAAVGWTNSHLWEFEIRREHYGPALPYDFGDGPKNAAKVRLGDVVDGLGAKTLRYTYDMGDSWEHTIKVEAVVEADAAVLYPRLLEAVGACPPEDIGGFPGYANFLEALADPAHEDHDHLVEWWGGDDFDPRAVDREAIEAELARLATRWSAARRRKAKASA